MNWVDYIILGLLLVALIIGVRRGLFHGINGLLGLAFGIIISITYVDFVTQRVLLRMRISPVMVTFGSLVILFVLTYLVFKILGYLFYKFAELKPLGRIGRISGAVFGVFEGGIVIGFILILFMFVPLPGKVVSDLDSSFFAPGLRGAIPFIYEESTFIHPKSPSFVGKMKKALLSNPNLTQDRKNLRFFPEERSEKIIEKMEYYFPSS